MICQQVGRVGPGRWDRDLGAHGRRCRSQGAKASWFGSRVVCDVIVVTWVGGSCWTQIQAHPISLSAATLFSSLYLPHVFRSYKSSSLLCQHRRYRRTPITLPLSHNPNLFHPIPTAPFPNPSCCPSHRQYWKTHFFTSTRLPGPFYHPLTHLT